jgi:UDP-N-acetylglucosamine diphosphorylase/glucosamine-1-phosphate N-acetyltransferase
VKAGARLYHGTAIGDQCRVAGEISQSVFQGYVNKQHDGFLGNSILGQWVNLGADTRTSNLRNDYGEVKVKVGKDLVRTGEQYIGLLAGDHVKTGINTMFNTATVVGVGANVYGAGYPPHFIGSYQMGGADGFQPASLERTLETAKIVMSRRNCELSAAEEELLRRHYAETVTGESQK